MNEYTTRQLGAWGEQCARRYLESHEWEILDMNWRVRGGELDIVGFDPGRGALVAVEVKTRRTEAKGAPEAAVTPTKLQRLRALLLQWVVKHDYWAPQIAVDVIGVRVFDGTEYTIDHVVGVQ
ncbi:putative endonuclease [Arcanobacterium wilhelmae]|uniref:UPF0102 protein J2S49_000402 n=1 Tax=Arcanobacterium wilhelmae TaxID=1803177 RepID=A0ABT9NA89_9ACTO|nr:YraN family protein [Arcanobacterium wilhelmae]MDP9800326.1 putative endonuclease [Arcanobacterium wilhelmae]WFN89762.1 YraN family protein [Arcanobacterium wilhelmae]